jgi:hypothetical protein
MFKRLKRTFIMWSNLNCGRNPPCQLPLWEETGAPAENPRLSAERWLILFTWVRSENRTHGLRSERRLLWRLRHRSPLPWGSQCAHERHSPPWKYSKWRMFRGWLPLIFWVIVGALFYSRFWVVKMSGYVFCDIECLANMYTYSHDITCA